MLINTALCAEVVDLLKPEYQRQEQDFKGVMEGLISGKVKYKIVTEKVEKKNMAGWPRIVEEKTVKMPKVETEKC